MKRVHCAVKEYIASAEEHRETGRFVSKVRSFNGGSDLTVYVGRFMMTNQWCGGVASPAESCRFTPKPGLLPADCGDTSRELEFLRGGFFD